MCDWRPHSTLKRPFNTFHTCQVQSKQVSVEQQTHVACYFAPFPSLPSILHSTYTSYVSVSIAVQCDMGWCCSSDGMIIPRSRKYTGSLIMRYHLSSCGYTVTCLSLDHVSTRDTGLATAPRLPISPFLIVCQLINS